MSRHPRSAMITAVALVAALASAAVAGGPGGATRAAPEDIGALSADRRGACSTHAMLLRRACFADRTDDFLAHIADCVYVTSEEDEQECRAEARRPPHQPSPARSALFSSSLLPAADGAT